jgi:hypothetical protein
MWAFLQTYGLWILLGLGALWLMSRSHGHAGQGMSGGCCGPDHETHPAQQEEAKAGPQSHTGPH